MEIPETPCSSVFLGGRKLLEAGSPASASENAPFLVGLCSRAAFLVEVFLSMTPQAALSSSRTVLCAGAYGVNAAQETKEGTFTIGCTPEAMQEKQTLRLHRLLLCCLAGSSSYRRGTTGQGNVKGAGH